jgi:hypothetical protein
MRGPWLYSLLFWILWGVMSLMVRPDDRNSPEFVIASGLGSFVFPILLYTYIVADGASLGSFFLRELKDFVREIKGQFALIRRMGRTRIEESSPTTRTSPRGRHGKRNSGAGWN